MRYPPEQVDCLAAEYVIGTLHGAARRRFASLAHQRADIRLAIWQWERLLHGLAVGIAPVRPPRAIWQGIRQRVSPSRAPRRHQVSWWPRLAVVAPLLAALAFWLATSVPPAADPDRMAVFSDNTAQALWIISADTDKGVLVAESSGVRKPEDRQVFELWALPDGGAPLSLGVLESVAGSYETTLSAELLAAIENSSTLAISLEPPGGSPTGAPTGPVVYQASLLRL